MLTFDELYQTHAADVRRFALWLSGDDSQADDITSETFVRAWGRRATIRTETLKAYLFTIARNAYLEQQRHDQRLSVLEDVHLAPGPNPEDQADAQLRLARVRDFLQTLPEIDRTAFVLRVQQELPYAEIARVLDLSLTAAKVKVHRVRKKLLTLFAEIERS